MEHLDCTKSSAVTYRISCSCEKTTDVMLYITEMGIHSECDEMIYLMFLFSWSAPATMLTSMMDRKHAVGRLRQQHYMGMLSLFGTSDQICVYLSFFAGNGCLWGLMSASLTQC